MGKMASGKSTMASRILQTFPNMKLMSIAEPVKNIARDLFDMKTKELNWR